MASGGCMFPCALRLPGGFALQLRVYGGVLPARRHACTDVRSSKTVWVVQFPAAVVGCRACLLARHLAAAVVGTLCYYLQPPTK